MIAQTARGRNAADRYRAANLQAALVISQDHQNFPEGSLAQVWSSMVLADIASTRDEATGPLFRRAAA